MMIQVNSNRMSHCHFCRRDVRLAELAKHESRCLAEMMEQANRAADEDDLDRRSIGSSESAVSGQDVPATKQPCYLCGEMVSTRFLEVHERRCARRWSSVSEGGVSSPQNYSDRKDILGSFSRPHISTTNDRRAIPRSRRYFLVGPVSDQTTSYGRYKRTSLSNSDISPRASRLSCSSVDSNFDQATSSDNTSSSNDYQVEVIRAAGSRIQSLNSPDVTCKSRDGWTANTPSPGLRNSQSSGALNSMEVSSNMMNGIRSTSRLDQLLSPCLRSAQSARTLNLSTPRSTTPRTPSVSSGTFRSRSQSLVLSSGPSSAKTPELVSRSESRKSTNGTPRSDKALKQSNLVRSSSVSYMVMSSRESLLSNTPSSTSSVISQSQVNELLASCVGDQRYIDVVFEQGESKIMICFICGREQGYYSLVSHERACFKKWHLANGKMPSFQTKPMPCRPSFMIGTAAAEYNRAAAACAREMDVKCITCNRMFMFDRIAVHQQQCSGVRRSSSVNCLTTRTSDVSLDQRLKAPTTPTTPKMETETRRCEHCGRSFGARALSLHGKLCALDNASGTNSGKTGKTTPVASSRNCGPFTQSSRSKGVRNITVEMSI